MTFGNEAKKRGSHGGHPHEPLATINPNPLPEGGREFSCVVSPSRDASHQRRDANTSASFSASSA